MKIFLEGNILDSEKILYASDIFSRAELFQLMEKNNLYIVKDLYQSGYKYGFYILYKDKLPGAFLIPAGFNEKMLYIGSASKGIAEQMRGALLKLCEVDCSMEKTKLVIDKLSAE